MTHWHPKWILLSHLGIPACIPNLAGVCSLPVGINSEAIKVADGTSLSVHSTLEENIDALGEARFWEDCDDKAFLAADDAETGVSLHSSASLLEDSSPF